MTDPAIIRFRLLLQAGLSALEERRQEVNDLNVFPVADGDTGDNMVLTLKAVLAELDRLANASEDRTIDEIGREEIVASVARAALLGARGNSGVILSQLIRGAAEELASRPGEKIDPVLIAAALGRAADQAYGSVRDPAEGTILTVAREMAHRIASEVAHMSDPRLSETSTDGDQDVAAAGVIEAALDTGQDSVKRGKDLLPQLRDAGVVDAGGYGLTVMFAGILGALRGERSIELEHHAPARVTHPQHESTTFRYCTNFAVTGTDLDQRYFANALEQLGDSVLVVGDQTTLKVHLHTDEPDKATALFAEAGAVSHLDVADMSEQVAERTDRLTGFGLGQAQETLSGAVAVATGEGIHRLFRDLGVETLDGGPTLNPSTYDLLAAIHAVTAEEVVVLPNSSNVFMAADRAAELSDKTVKVVPTRSLQAGLAAAVALEPHRGAEQNAEAMSAAVDAIHTGGVARAARDDAQGRFKTGEAVGFVDDELVAWGEPKQTLADVLGRLGSDAELITVISGEDAPADAEFVRSLVDGDAELELSEGGQSSYWWLLSAE
ncbi:MAG: DAK2 domain-containing protein [Solirubrobacterales bacterium]|nr:DAK2 domain-containing protein [Solirubrobacterales bacterium]